MFRDWGTCVENGVATFSCIPVIFLNVLGALLMFAGLTALVIFLIGTFKYIDSEGDPKKLESAKHNFEFGITGLAIVIFSFAIISIISIVTRTPCIRTFGFDCSASTSVSTPTPSSTSTPTPTPVPACDYYTNNGGCSACVSNPNCEWDKSIWNTNGFCTEYPKTCNSNTAIHRYTVGCSESYDLCPAATPAP